MKTKTILYLLLLSFSFSCTNDADEILSGPQQETQSSVFVTIKDQNGIPVPGAQIVFGQLTGTTDEGGTYFFTKAMLTGDDYMTVSKTGYFNGSRRFTSKGSATQFVQVTLLSREEVASYKSSNGASLYIDNKSRILFPNDAVTRQDGSSYSGDVHVMASLIYGDDPNLTDKMPGALVGRDEAGATMGLSSFGMILVELQGDNGEKLNVAPGKLVTLEIAVAQNQINNAPSTIPLWYFDEIKGIWIQEGQAALQGNVYVGQVSHFTPWNVDVPLEMVNWETTVVFEDGTPAQNLIVCTSTLEFSNQMCLLTDANGIAAGSIPQDMRMTFSIKDDCGTTLITEEIGPFGDDVKLNTRTLSGTSIQSAKISGVAIQCDGQPVKSGFARIQTPANNYILPVSPADGTFDGQYIYCNGDFATIYVYDVVNNLVSTPRTFTFERTLNMGTVSACNVLDEFIQYKVKGFSKEYMYYIPELKLLGTEYVEIESIDSIGFKGRFGFVFNGRNPGQYPAHGAYGNQINLPNGQVAFINSMTVNVTEFGPPGEFIRGNFFGRLTKGGNGAGGNGQSDFSGSFALKNE